MTPTPTPLAKRVERELRSHVAVNHQPSGRLLASRGLTTAERKAPSVSIVLLGAVYNDAYACERAAAGA